MKERRRAIKSFCECLGSRKRWEGGGAETEKDGQPRAHALQFPYFPSPERLE